MRIEFQHSARDDFYWGQAQLRVGSGADCDLVLPANVAAAQHLLIEQDRRGWILKVLPGAGRIYVNARPVRERAFLRAGDMLGLGECRLLLHADQDPHVRQDSATCTRKPCPVALRAVAGPLSGRVLPVRHSLRLGPTSTVALMLPGGEIAGFQLCWQNDRLRLAQDQASTRYPLRVNGSRTSGLDLRCDDQIGVGMHRFIVDAPGLTPEPIVRLAEPVPEPLPEDVAGPRGEAWWLILTAAVLALGIALVLLIRL